jgi:hypothetical protein
MQTSARPRTLVLVVSGPVIDVAMLGPRGQELGERQVVPLTSETASLWRAIESLGEFDRITMIGPDVHGLGDRIARQSQRSLRRMSLGALHWTRTIRGSGVELAVALAPRFSSSLFHDGVEVPGIDLGWLQLRKDKRVREYLAPRVVDRKGDEAWMQRVIRAVDEILAIWNPTTLYIAASPLPMPPLPARVVVVPATESFADALDVWEPVDAAAHPNAVSPRPT